MLADILLDQTLLCKVCKQNDVSAQFANTAGRGGCNVTFMSTFLRQQNTCRQLVLCMEEFVGIHNDASIALYYRVTFLTGPALKVLSVGDGKIPTKKVKVRVSHRENMKF